LENLYRSDYKAMTESFIYNENPLSFDKLKIRILELIEKFRGNM